MPSRSLVRLGSVALAGIVALFFIGAVQGLVVDSSLAGDAARMNRRAPRAFALLVDGVRGRLRKR